MKNSLLLLLFVSFFLTPLFLSANCIHQPVFQADTLFGQLNNNSKDALILFEDNTIQITGKKADFIEYVVTKELKVKILNEEGLKRFSSYLLPEEFDPTYISHFPEARKYTNVLAELKPDFFGGTIYSKDGQEKEAIIEESTNIVEMVIASTNYYGNFEQPHFVIQNLSIGDELQLKYSYHVRFNMNFLELSSFRVFFNSDIYKNDYHLKISHESDLETSFKYLNGGDPDTIYNQDNLVIYEWFKKKLVDCIDEPGSRPYLQLPYVIFSITPYELLYMFYDSFEERFIPFYSLFSYVREAEHLNIARSVHQGVNTRQFSQINKFVLDQTEGISNDTLNYLKLLKVHNTIADEFKFDPDIDYFKKIDTRDPRMGDYISKRTLRDISRYDLYVYLILKMNLGYFTAYLCDNRVGRISNEYFAPMEDSDYLFAIMLQNNTIQYLYPKKSRFGYYLNEVPFYFENAFARLVSLNDYRNFKEPIAESLRQVKLPGSVISDNQRKTNIMVQINTDSLVANFKARVNLSGQYSTMTRGLYLYDEKDKTVNELYNTKLWEFNDDVKFKKPKIEVVQKEFPFPAKLTADYSSRKILEKNQDTLRIDMSRWFNHIIYSDFTATNRQLDFYPDFVGQDTYVYFLQFDHPVKLLESVETVNIKNNFSELTISATQSSPNSIKISSNYIVKSEVVKAENIKWVKDIFEKIQNLNHSQLTILME